MTEDVTAHDQEQSPHTMEGRIRGLQGLGVYVAEFGLDRCQNWDEVWIQVRNGLGLLLPHLPTPILTDQEVKITDPVSWNAYNLDPVKENQLTFIVDDVSRNIHLTTLEYSLVHRLVRAKGGLVLKAELNSTLGTDEYNHVLKVHASRVNRKIGQPSIKNIHNFGYLLLPLEEIP